LFKPAFFLRGKKPIVPRLHTGGFQAFDRQTAIYRDDIYANKFSYLRRFNKTVVQPAFSQGWEWEIVVAAIWHVKGSRL
jgi:hypothetical protein